MKKHIEIIERMMFAMANHTVDGKRIYPTLKAAKEALEKQLPKKVETFFPLAKAECPSCKGRIEAYASHNNCAWCGQAFRLE